MISIRNLKKSFGDHLIFENVNLEIDKGDSVVIIGGSGCGKSTLLRCINRLEKATEGQVIIDGADIQAPDANVELIRRKLGMVYQSFNLFSHLNVMENMILAPMKVLKMPKNEAIDEAKRLLEMVGMENRGDRMPSQLSGGQKQRVAIARAMMMKPEVMLFDEPTSALDPTMVDEVESVIRRLNKDGMTSVIVTHEMRFAKSISTKVVFLAEKSIYEQGTPKEIFENSTKKLTRQFLFRNRLFERTISKNDVDIYSLCSELKNFAAPYGFDRRQMQGIELMFDELIFPFLRIDPEELGKMNIRFLAEESGKDHKIWIEFPFIHTNPLEHECLDELNQKILRGYTKELTAACNKDGVWEVQAKI